MISGSQANAEIVIARMVQRDEVHIFDKGKCIAAWSQSDMHQINVRSFDGDDLIAVADSVAFPVEVAGGLGTDTV